MSRRGDGRGRPNDRARQQDKVRNDKAKAAERREAERVRGEKIGKAIRDDPNRRHPW